MPNLRFKLTGLQKRLVIDYIKVGLHKTLIRSNIKNLATGKIVSHATFNPHYKRLLKKATAELNSSIKTKTAALYENSNDAIRLELLKIDRQQLAEIGRKHSPTLKEMVKEYRREAETYSLDEIVSSVMHAMVCNNIKPYQVKELLELIKIKYHKELATKPEPTGSGPMLAPQEDIDIVTQNASNTPT